MEVGTHILLLRRTNLFTCSTASHPLRWCLVLDFFKHSTLPFQTETECKYHAAHREKKSSLMAACVQHKSPLSYECHYSTRPKHARGSAKFSKAKRTSEALLPSNFPLGVRTWCSFAEQNFKPFMGSCLHPLPSRLSPLCRSFYLNTAGFDDPRPRVEKLTRGGRMTLCI